MGDALVDHGARGQVAGSVLIGRVGSKESHVVSLGTDDKSKGGLVLVTADLGSSFFESLELLPVRVLARAVCVDVAS